jgi:DNA polymerase I-like protein with 3'-5' exonuclease and polymerase domains
MVRTIRDPNQIPLLLPDSGWRPREEFPDLHDLPVVSVDTETRDPGIGKETGSSWARGEGEVIGVSVSSPRGTYYYPVGHLEDNLDRAKVFDYLRRELGRFEGELVGANLVYDLGWLRRENVRCERCTFWDVQYAEAILDEHRSSYSLDAIAYHHKLPQKDETLLREAANVFCVDPKAGMYRLPARYVGAYAEHDADLPFKIRELQLPLVAQDQVEKVLKLEHDLLPLNMLMQERGVRVNLDRVWQVRKALQEKEREQHVIIKRESGLEVEVWSGQSVATAFLQLGIDFPRTALDAPSIQQSWLSGHDHPVCRAILAARRYNKAWSTFIDGTILEHVDKNGYVHPSWHPLRGENGGAGPGRYSCSDPNMQQIPARNEDIAPLLRSCFVPEDGEEWWVFDVKQQEPRFTVHYAALRDLPKAREAAERIRNDPSTDYHQMVADMTGLPRKQAKEINLGKAYGMGGAKLCHKLGLPTEFWYPEPNRPVEVAGPEGKRILKQYENEFPFISRLSKDCQNAAIVRGWIRTYAGRLQRFPRWWPKGWGTGGDRRPLPYDLAIEKYGQNIERAWTKDAMNKLIQGSSADMMKQAMLMAWREEKVIPYGQVHDELDASLGSEEKARRVDRCVRESVELLVPMHTDVERGPNWGDCKLVEDW